MLIHQVSQGECVSSIAKQYGLRDWQAIYHDPANQALRARRPNPNLLYPGDIVRIPDKAARQTEQPVGQPCTFKVKGRRIHLRLLVEEFDGTAVAGRDYHLEVGTEVFTGRTGGDGLVEHEIAVDADAGELTVWLDDERQTALYWPLRIGFLDPHDELPGAQERLNNLGLDNLADGATDDRSQAAIKAFQRQHGLAESGGLDAATKDKARAVYGF